MLWFLKASSADSISSGVHVFGPVGFRSFWFDKFVYSNLIVGDPLFIIRESSLVSDWYMSEKARKKTRQSLSLIRSTSRKASSRESNFDHSLKNSPKDNSLISQDQFLISMLTGPWAICKSPWSVDFDYHLSNCLKPFKHSIKDHLLVHKSSNRYKRSVDID